MGKKAKGIRAEKRKKEKRAAKDRRAAMYKSHAAAGRTKNSKRFSLKNKRGKVSFTKHTHPDGPCGNLACQKCFPGTMSTENKMFRAHPESRKERLKREALNKWKAKAIAKLPPQLQPRIPTQGEVNAPSAQS